MLNQFEVLLIGQTHRPTFFTGQVWLFTEQRLAEAFHFPPAKASQLPLAHHTVMPWKVHHRLSSPNDGGVFSTFVGFQNANLLGKIRPMFKQIHVDFEENQANVLLLRNPFALFLRPSWRVCFCMTGLSRFTMPISVLKIPQNTSHIFRHIIVVCYIGH